MSSLLGLELSKATALLDKQGVKYTVAEYAAVKPLCDTDSARIVRETENNGTVELLFGRFKTKA